MTVSTDSAARPARRGGWRARVIGALLLALGAGAAGQGTVAAEGYIEPPLLAERVAAGTLPPVAARLPQTPAVATMDWPDQTIGRHGGQITMLMASAKDVRIMVVYGYARLVGYDSKLELAPDLLERVEDEEDRVFTFHLRPGHKWSDGAPFTTEDFRYFWEDVANHDDLSPTGPPHLMLVNGEPPKIDIIDATTIRYSWSQPNPDFLPALAGPSPLYIYRPSHYLKQFHEKYADPAALAEAVAQSGQRDWAALHNRKDNMYRNDNPALPTLDPWMLLTEPPSERFVFERNPYYHRVDAEGRQLPYLDRVIFQIADNKIIPAKVGAGESDLQARYLRFDNYTFLKAGETRGGYDVLLWDSGYGSQLALYPNLNVKDPGWRALTRDVRFRRALSMAIDRSEINQVIYHGLAHEAADTVLPKSPVYKPDYGTAWTNFDPDAANRLLDEIGLTARDDNGTRLMPDGRPLDIIVETAGESTEQTDVLELMRDGWRAVGIRLFTRPSEREMFRNRIFAGETVMSVWTGLENGLPTAQMSPSELAPTTQQQLQWPKWGQYVETKGESGEPVDLPEAEELARLLGEWYGAKTRADHEEIWDEMLRIRAEQVYSIGTVSGVPQPVIVNDRLRNVPRKGVYSWEPGAHFGIYRPDCFWLDESGKSAS